MVMKSLCIADLLPDSRRIVIYPSESDFEGYRNVFLAKSKKEERLGKKLRLEVEIQLPPERRTFKQNSAFWALLRIIWKITNGEKRNPTKQEEIEMYYDFLDAYADRKENKITGENRPIHISESNTRQCAILISSEMDLLATIPDIPMSAQAEVKTWFAAWVAWRGRKEFDPLDYDEAGIEIEDRIWRKRHQVSEASGCGPVQKAHIVSRGADPTLIDRPWNWIALTPKEHVHIQHQNGWDFLIGEYPHIEAKILKARKKAALLQGGIQ
jgi:hypothetical protein